LFKKNNLIAVNITNKCGLRNKIHFFILLQLVESSDGSKKKKNGGFKLLRKPRAPKLPPIPFPPSPDPAERPFYENYEFENEEYETYSSFHQSPPPSAVPSLISPPPSESNPKRGINGIGGSFGALGFRSSLKPPFFFFLLPSDDSTSCNKIKK
jgi:hypothetical protein